MAHLPLAERFTTRRGVLDATRPVPRTPVVPLQVVVPAAAVKVKE